MPKSREPVKVYSEAWYENIRPKATMSEKKVVDTKMLEVMNTLIFIEKDMRAKY